MSSFDPPPPPATFVGDATIEVWDEQNANLVRVLETAYNASYSDPTSDVIGGDGQFTIVKSHPDGALDQAALQRGRFVRFVDRGTVLWTGRIRSRQWKETTVLPGEVLTTVSLPGQGDILRDSLIAPPPGTNRWKGVQSRGYGWYSGEVDETELGTPTVGAPVYGSFAQHPRAFPDVFCAKFTDDRYYRRTFTVLTTLVFVPYASASMNANVWLNGVPLGPLEAPPSTSEDRTWRGGIVLEPGTHVLAVENTSSVESVAPWLAVSCFYSAPDGISGWLNRATFLFHTGYIPDTTTIDPWKSSDLPVGITPGRLARAWLQEGQLRGRLAGVSLSCTDTVDSAGNPWAERVIDMRLPIGSTHVDAAMARLVETYCDIAWDPESLTIDLFNYAHLGTYAGDEGTYPGTLYAATEVGGRNPNLVDADVQEPELQPTRLLVVGANETFWYGEEGGEEGELILSDYTDRATLERIAEVTIAKNIDQATAQQLSGRIEPTNGDDLPHRAGCRKGDAIRWPRDGVAERTRLMGINGSLDPNRRWVWDLELNQRLEEHEAQQAKWLERISPSGLSGKIESVSSGASDFGVGVGWAVLEESPREVFSLVSPALDMVSPAIQIESPERAYWINWGLQKPSTSGDLVIYLRKNGTMFHTLTIPAGAGIIGGSTPGLGEAYTNLAVTKGDYIDGVVHAMGDGADGLTVNLFLTSQI